MGLTAADIAEIKERHIPGPFEDHPECAECLRPLPCDAVLLLEENERLQHELAGRASTDRSPARGVTREGTIESGHAIWCNLQVGGSCDCQAMSA